MSALICLLFCFMGAVAYSLPEVNLTQGRVTGLYQQTINGRRLSAFLGVPYAKPPVGKKRFNKAVPAGPWLGIYNATHYGPECLQYSHLSYAIKGSEDCLYLNIFTPELPKSNKIPLLDVIVYIHGGAFMYHSANEYKPGYLLDKDLVLVTINYRVGPLGFLSTEDAVLPGNNGLKDQTLALRWIHENIEHFGGNPNSVTIAGMSAGGASIHYHLLSPLSAGLFRRAISMSGSAFCPWTLMENSMEKAKRIAFELGCPTENSKDLVDCMRKRPAEHIVSLSKLYQPWLFNPFSPFGPVVEHHGETPFLPQSPLKLMQQGKMQDVPWLTSFTSHEGLYPAAEFLPDESLLNQLDLEWNKLAPHLLDYNFTISKLVKDETSRKIREHYLGNKTVVETSARLVDLLSDRLYIVGIAQAALLQASIATAPVYVYKFSYRGLSSLTQLFTKTDKDYGVSHADDTGYVFNVDYMNVHEATDDKAMSQLMVNVWYTFAKTGKPSPTEGLVWSSVQQGLPDLWLTEILSSGNLVKCSTSNPGNVHFWQSLNLADNEIEHEYARLKDEL